MKVFVYIKFGLLLLLSIAFIQHPGEIAVKWYEWDLSMPFGVFILVLIFIVFFGFFLTRFFLSTIYGSKFYLLSRFKKRQKKELLALQEICGAIFTGNEHLAEKALKKSGGALSSDVLSRFLQSEVAGLRGKTEKQEKLLEEISYDEVMGEFALYKLLQKAFAQENTEQVLELLSRTEELASKASWLLEKRFELYYKLENWQEAFTTLEAIEKEKLFSKEEINRYKEEIGDKLKSEET
ncbi:MAG: heme biosynthesis HemY N-terminal domain-containing protein [Alphaproteobacteria bacterium]